MKAHSICRGYSVIELLTALGLLALAHAWLVPALSEFVDSFRVNSGAQAISGSLMLARSEAIKRNARVVVCKSARGESCETDASWAQGWIVFHDPNNNRAVDPGEYVLHREQSLPPAMHLTGNGPVSTYVSYTPYGKTRLTSGAFQAGTFTVCARSGKEILARKVVINNSGRVRVSQVSLEECT
jgi:type IV fimbrial biogenesis protein FimT